MINIAKYGIKLGNDLLPEAWSTLIQLGCRNLSPTPIRKAMILFLRLGGESQRFWCAKQESAEIIVGIDT